MNARTLLPLTLVALVSLLAGCEEEDVVSLRVRLNQDLSGTIVASGLAVPTTPGPIEKISSGVTWANRAQVVAASGEFFDLSALRVSEVSFHHTADGVLHHLKIRLPRGRDVAWARGFLPADLDDDQRRARVAKTLDPEGNLRRIGTTVKLALELPGDIVSHGVDTKARRMEERVNGREATLVIPSHVAFTKDRDIVWLLTWRAAE